jgi:hypothetical protein
MKFTIDEVRVIWLAMHSYQPYDPELACGLTEDQQLEVCREVRNKIFSEICDSIERLD